MDVKAGAEISIVFDMTFRSRADDKFLFRVTVEREEDQHMQYSCLTMALEGSYKTAS